MTEQTTEVPDGMELAECTAEPRHSPVFAPLNEDAWYPTPCPWCLTEEAWERLRELENAEEKRKHQRHRLFARTRFARRLASWAYRLGVISGYGVSWNSACRRCVHGVHFDGSRPYVLGWPAWKWACLRRGHWPGEYIAFDCCGKCLPCPACGSTTSGHRDDCQEA